VCAIENPPPSEDQAAGEDFVREVVFYSGAKVE
jgi:hypothetical protein